MHAAAGIGGSEWETSLLQGYRYQTCGSSGTLGAIAEWWDEMDFICTASQLPQSYGGRGAWGKLYAIGGQFTQDHTGAKASVYRWNPDTNKWTTVAPLLVLAHTYCNLCIRQSNRRCRGHNHQRSISA